MVDVIPFQCIIVATVHPTGIPACICLMVTAPYTDLLSDSEQCWARSSIFGSALAFLRSSGRG